MTSLHANEAFLDHYQFTHDPFAARVPGFKFFPAQRKPVLGQLHHLARYSQLLLVVTGPEGSGKTLLRQALVASTNKQTVHTVVVSAQGAADPATLMRHIGQGLSARQSDRTSLLAQIGQLAIAGQEVYLLIDDAEELSDAALDELLILAKGDSEGRPHVFLFADSELNSRLDALEGAEESFHVIELQPYSEDETREYLAQRLEGAAQGLKLLSEQQIEQIHERSAGWPGGINNVARDTLIAAMLARRGEAKRGGFSFNLPKKHLLALGVVAIGVVLALLLQGRSSAPESTTASLQPEAQPQSAQSGSAPAIEFAGSSQPVPLPLAGQSQPVIRQPLAQAAGEGDADGSLELPDEVVAAPVTAPTAAAPTTAPAPVTAVAPAPAVAAPAPVAKESVAKAAGPTQPKVAAAKPKAQAAPAAQKGSAAASASTGAARASGWYAAQAKNHYTLQVFGSSSENAAKAFVQQNGAQYHYFKKVHQGKPLYVVTYGSFASRDAALAAVKSLPAKIQAGKPWPKTFASVSQEVAL